MLKRMLMAAFVVVGAALPASAGSITLNSSNCDTGGPGSCYGLTWTLDVEAGSFTGVSGSYGYSATLTIADDLDVTGTPTETISAVVIKASDDIGTYELFSAPTTTGPWVTVTNNLSSNGCTGGSGSFVCSSTTGTEAVTGSTPLQFVWYFNSDDASIANVGDTLHIGAKMTTLDPFVAGKLLSKEVAVPEPASLSLLGVSLLGLAGVRRRVRR